MTSARTPLVWILLSLTIIPVLNCVPGDTPGDIPPTDEQEPNGSLDNATPVQWDSLGRALLRGRISVGPQVDEADYFALGPLQLTVGGMLDAMRLALRALGIAFVVAALLYTTAQPALVSAMVRLGLPYPWGLTVSLTLRFLPAIQDLYHTVRDAQAARGWVAEGPLFRRLKEHLPVLVAVMIGTLRMSDQLTLALAARGLETTRQRTTWRALRMRQLDWGVALGATLAFCLLAWWQFAN